jgi:hypothetical protein
VQQGENLPLQSHRLLEVTLAERGDSETKGGGAIAMEPTSDRRKSDPISFRPWEDNYSFLEKLSNDSGRPIREICRDIVDEAVQARLKPPTDFGADIKLSLEFLIEQSHTANERHEEMVKKYEQLAEELVKKHEQLAEREAKLRQGLISQLRKFGRVLGEVLAASIGGRRLVWNYIAYEVLKASNYSESEIKGRYEAENKAWNAERDETVNQVNKIVEENPSAPE